MNVFLCEPIEQSAYLKLKNHFYIINDYKDIHLAHCIITRNIQVNKSIIDQCPSLRLIAVHGSGVDDVDIDYAFKKNIKVINTPSLNALSVAEMNITLMLELSRNIYHVFHDKKMNLYHEVANPHYIGHEISYKTVGFVGYGNIAKMTSDILINGFHMNIQSYDPYYLSNDIKLVSLEDLFKSSDYIIISCSLNDETHHLINRDLLQLMKPTAYLINTSRGAIINEDDLYELLIQHKIAGVGLDVIEGEPVEYNHRLLTLDQVIYTSHMGASTHEALYRVGHALVNQIIDLLND